MSINDGLETLVIPKPLTSAIVFDTTTPSPRCYKDTIDGATLVLTPFFSGLLPLLQIALEEGQGPMRNRAYINIRLAECASFSCYTGECTDGTGERSDVAFKWERYGVRVEGNLYKDPITKKMRRARYRCLEIKLDGVPAAARNLWKGHGVEKLSAASQAFMNFLRTDEAAHLEVMLTVNVTIDVPNLALFTGRCEGVVERREKALREAAAVEQETSSGQLSRISNPSGPAAPAYAPTGTQTRDDGEENSHVRARDAGLRDDGEQETSSDQLRDISKPSRLAKPPYALPGNSERTNGGGNSDVRARDAGLRRDGEQATSLDQRSHISNSSRLAEPPYATIDLTTPPPSSRPTTSSSTASRPTTSSSASLGPITAAKADVSPSHQDQASPHIASQTPHCPSMDKGKRRASTTNDRTATKKTKVTDDVQLAFEAEGEAIMAILSNLDALRRSLEALVRSEAVDEQNSSSHDGEIAGIEDEMQEAASKLRDVIARKAVLAGILRQRRDTPALRNGDSA